MKGAFMCSFFVNRQNFILNFCKVKTCYRRIFLVLFFENKM